MKNLCALNNYVVKFIDNKNCIIFVTGGKNQVEVIVDLETWQNYLHKYHWTAIKNDNYIQVKTSVNKHSVRLHRMIVENEYSEIDYWGNTIDHINNNPLDNRIANLRIYNSKLNSTNIRSKYADEGLHLIYPQLSKVNDEKIVCGYKVHTNIFDETVYKNFQTVEEAIKYRDSVVLPYIEIRLNDLIKKTRNIEFERGLRDKLNNNEVEEIISILEKYNFKVTKY